MATQFDIIRKQAESAARNTAARAQGTLRRDTSLVGQASRWAGRAMREGEDTLRDQIFRGRSSRPTPRKTEAVQTGPIRPAPDGYVRRSPIQPLHVAEDYRRRQLLWVAAAAAILIGLGLGIYLLGQLGIFMR